LKTAPTTIAETTERIAREREEVLKQRRDASYEWAHSLDGTPERKHWAQKLADLRFRMDTLDHQQADLDLAAAEDERHTKAQAEQNAEAQRKRAAAKNGKLTADRAVVWDEIAEVVRTLADLSAQCAALDAEIDRVRKAIDPATREHINRQSLARILDVLSTRMAEAGFQRAFPWPDPAHRVHNPGAY
jgi:chromosome segregation ATPase